MSHLFCVKTKQCIFQVYDWAKGQCETKQMKINEKHLKLFMAPLVPHLCIEKMDMKTLTSTFYEYKLIPDAQLLNVFRDHIVGKESVVRDAHTPPRSTAPTKRSSLRTPNSQNKRARFEEVPFDEPWDF